MNKTKKVAWHKHLKTARKRAEKARVARQAGATSAHAATSRPATKR